MADAKTKDRALADELPDTTPCATSTGAAGQTGAAQPECKDWCKELWLLSPVQPKGFSFYRKYDKPNVTYNTPGGMSVTREIPIVTEGWFRIDSWADLAALAAEGKRTSSDTVTWARRVGHPTDEAGHVIPREFSGNRKVGEDGNIVPMSGRANNSNGQRISNLIKKLHKNGTETVCARVIFEYTDTMYRYRPRFIRWELIYTEGNQVRWVGPSRYTDNPELRYESIPGDMLQQRPGGGN